MALSVSVREFPFVASKREVVAAVTFDSSYVTGGESFVPANVGLTQFLFVSVHSAAGYTFEFDYSNNKIKVFSGGSEVANATDLSSLATRVRVIGV